MRSAAPRRAAIAVLATAVATWAGAGATATAVAAGAPTMSAPTTIVQSQTGVASGFTHRDQTAHPSQVDTGAYSSSGQLGAGKYTFHQALSFSSCSLPSQVATTSGTATLTRSDGAVVSGTITGQEHCNENPDTETFHLTLTHGSRDLVGAHLTFTGPFTFSLKYPVLGGTGSFFISGTATTNTRLGYWMVDRAGRVSAFGGVNHLGDAPTSSAAHIEPTSTRDGYWIVDGLGHVYAFGSARWYGNAGATALARGEVVTSLSATNTGHGYWLFTDHGRVLPFGDAHDYGDLHSVALNGPVVGSVATPTGHGYYLVASDGGVFAFGDAEFHGSMGTARLNRPINGLVPTADGRGYWLVASDGGVFAFNAPFRGSTGSLPLRQPIIGMVRFGTGYLMVARDGGIFNFSLRPFFGSLGGSALANPVVGAASAG